MVCHRHFQRHHDGEPQRVVGRPARRGDFDGTGVVAPPVPNHLRTLQTVECDIQVTEHRQANGQLNADSIRRDSLHHRDYRTPDNRNAQQTRSATGV